MKLPLDVAAMWPHLSECARYETLDDGAAVLMQQVHLVDNE